MELDGEFEPTIEGVGICTLDGKLWQLPRPNRHHHVISLIHSETGQRVPGGA